MLEAALLYNGTYDANVRPEVARLGRLDAPPEKVEIQFDIRAYTIDESTQTFQVHGFMQIAYYDWRLQFYYKSDVALGFIDGMGVKVSIHNNPAEWTLKGAYAYTNSEDLWGQAWDYALLTLRFKRRSWYYVMEVFFPTIMFLLISYAGFFVARESAPARVATAVLPVLILRTRVSPALLNSVYAGRPRYSTSIFLCQLLVTAEALSTYAILHYILVQHFLIIEHGALARRRALAELADIAAPEEIPLEPVGATGDGDEAAADEADAEDVRLSQRFSVSKRSSRVITRDESCDPLRSAEMDTLRRIFSSCDASGDGKIDHRELQTALKWYGVFLSPEDALRNVEIFLSKNNRPIPTAARHLTLNFDDFCEFMLYYDLKYRLAVSVSPSIKNSLLYQPPSLRLDIAARILCIPACIVCTAVLYLVHFGSNPPRSDEY
ncbi:GABA-A receptor [Aureococcus anophagefferens]|nr:GABA-A receptor [Aureococcus anophagefferens]